MSVFRRFSNIVQQKSNAALDKMEDPSQAIDLSYQQLLEQQQKLRTALVEASTGEKRVENQAKTMDTRIAQLNDAAQKAVAAGKDDLATQALTQAEVLTQQRQALDPQIATLKAQVEKLQLALQKYQAKVQAFATQRESLKASYEAAKATSAAGDTLAGHRRAHQRRGDDDAARPGQDRPHPGARRRRRRPAGQRHPRHPAAHRRHQHPGGPDQRHRGGQQRAGQAGRDEAAGRAARAGRSGPSGAELLRGSWSASTATTSTGWTRRSVPTWTPTTVAWWPRSRPMTTPTTTRCCAR